MVNYAPTQKSICKELGLDWEKVKKANRKRLFKRAPWLHGNAATWGGKKEKGLARSFSITDILRLFRRK